MKKTLLVAGAAAFFAGGLAYYLFSRARSKSSPSPEAEKHLQQVAGEKKLRRVLHAAKHRPTAAG